MKLSIKVRNLLTKITVAITIVFVSSAVTNAYYQESKKSLLHIDEYFFLLKAEFFELFFIQHDTTHLLWQQLDPSQPKIGPYLFGASLYLHQVKNFNHIFQAENLNLKTIDQIYTSQSSKVLQNPKTIKTLIFYTRKAAVLFSFLSFLVLGIYLTKTGSSLYRTIICIILLSQNRVMLEVGHRALTDSMQLFSLIATILFTYKLTTVIKEPAKTKHQYIYAISIGIATAFGVGVKSSGILTCLFAVIMMLLFVRKNPNQLKKCLQLSIISVLVFFSIVITIHPFLYQNTATNFLSMFTNRLKGSVEMRNLYNTTAVHSPMEAIKKILVNTVLPFGKYNSFPLPGVDLLLITIGIVFSVKKVFQNKGKSTVTPELIQLVFACVTFTTLIFYLKNDWQRYYLPFILSLTLIESYAIEKGVIKLSQKLDD